MDSERVSNFLLIELNVNQSSSIRNASTVLCQHPIQASCCWPIIHRTIVVFHECARKTGVVCLIAKAVVCLVRSMPVSTGEVQKALL